MARRSSSSKVPKWLRHRTLISAEAVLLVGALKDVLSGQLKRSGMPSWAIVLVVMAMTLGVLGGLFLIIQKLTARSVAKSHEVVQALPLPTPVLLIHAALFVGLFLLYARLLELPLELFGWQW